MIRRLFNRLFRRPIHYVLAVDTGQGLIVVGLLNGNGFVCPDKAKMQILGAEKYAASPEGIFFGLVFEQIRKRKLPVFLVPAAAVDGLVSLLLSAKDTRHQKYLVKAKAE